MFRYKSKQERSQEEFKNSFEVELQDNNRWIKLAELLPWDEFAEIYRGSFHVRFGAPSVDARIVIGALIIKHKLKLDDRGTIEMIRENPYMQYFLGLSAFRSKAVFDPSLFVMIRKRLGAEAFDEMTDELMKTASALEKESRKKQGSKEDPGVDEDSLSPRSEEPTGAEEQSDGEAEVPPTHKGILKIDATVCDQYIKYPTDLDLTARARLESERLIDILCKLLKVKVKPRTYREKARWRYLLAAKNKKLSRRKRYTAIGQQLRYLRRNLGHLDGLLDRFERMPFGKRDEKIFDVIQQLYVQQEEMWRKKVHRCDHRIVSIYQPHVRPIVRGKAGKNVEFGTKISISLVDRLTRIDRLSWEAFNESQILEQQIDAYRAEHAYWPEKVAVDHIYGTRENRRSCKQRGIELQVKPLGRPVAEAPGSGKLKKKDHIHRNDLEGKFGEGKNGFNLNKIRATLQETSESWIAAIFFVMNINELVRRAGVFALLLITAWRLVFQFYRPMVKHYANAMADIIHNWIGFSHVKVEVVKISP